MPTQAQRAEYRARMRKELNMLARVNARPRGYFPEGWGPDGDRNMPLAEQMGGLALQYGQTPDDATLEKFIRMRGGMAAADAPIVRSPGGTNGGVVSEEMRAPEPKQESKLDKLLAAIQAQSQAANDANEARNQEIRMQLGGYGQPQGLYARTMGELDNYGRTQEEDMEEASAADFAKVQSNLAGRGLQNTSITDAFRLKNSDNLRRRKLELSEMLSDRRIRNDQNLTDNLSRFIERQEDVGPDQSMMLELLKQYGQSGEGQGFAGVQGQPAPAAQPSLGYQPMQQLPIGGGWSPQAAASFQAQVNQSSPFVAAQNALGGLNLFSGGNFNSMPQYGGYTQRPSGGDGLPRPKARRAYSYNTGDYTKLPNGGGYLANGVIFTDEDYARAQRNRAKAKMGRLPTPSELF